MTEELATGIVFTSATCPHCPIAKKYFEELKQLRDDIDLHVLSVNDPEGSKMAEGFGIKSVPSFVFYGPGHADPMGLVGAQPKDVLIKYIDIAVGKKQLKNKPSFSVKNFLRKK